jgi:hypothetical protein
MEVLSSSFLTSVLPGIIVFIVVTFVQYIASVSPAVFYVECVINNSRTWQGCSNCNVLLSGALSHVTHWCVCVSE